jgi:signal transduction histidine kinase
VARLFDPFFAGAPGCPRGGLAAVLGVVRAHGGVLRVDQGRGAESAVRVLLRAAP